jgi:nitroreductase
MELYDVMRTTFAAREFTDDPLPDATLARILDHARFAPSGGNRQGWHVIVVRDRAGREALAAAAAPAAKRYAAQVKLGESPWNTIVPTRADAGTIEATPPPTRLIEPVLKAPVVLVVCVDLKVVASMDQSSSASGSSAARRSIRSPGTSCSPRGTRGSAGRSRRWPCHRSRSFVRCSAFRRTWPSAP